MSVRWSLRKKRKMNTENLVLNAKVKNCKENKYKDAKDNTKQTENYIDIANS